MSLSHSFTPNPIQSITASPDIRLARLAQRIQGQIEERAGGRIRDLHVECFENLVVLEGRARTYHAKQLAQEAALDLLDRLPCLANNIVVF